MIISLLGYMGSGKSHISKKLSSLLGFQLIDLDFAIADKHQLNISEIFEKKGEIYFRKIEREALEFYLKNRNSNENLILSLGGGTPVYYDNMNLIIQNSESVFLRASVSTLTERLLKEKSKRPLIANLPEDQLPEFVAKHLFERNFYYNQAKIIVDTDRKTGDEIASEIIQQLQIV